MHRLDFTESDITLWCKALVAEILECAPDRIDPSVKFSRLGLDSAMSVQLIIGLETKLGFELSPDVVADYPTIARLATHVAALAAQQLHQT